MKMSRVIHFEFSSDDPLRTVQFYKAVFGWEIVKIDGPVDYWLIATGKEEQPGINGAVKSREDSGQNTVVTIEVDDIDETLNRIATEGGVIMTQKSLIPGIGYHAYCRDADGNVIGILQMNQMK